MTFQGSEKYINRELSWLEFNGRVLNEAQDKDNPTLERLRYLAIFESNLDEFYMVRVSGLIEQFESNLLQTSPDGLTPNEQLRAISEQALPMRKKAWKVFTKGIQPDLEAAGIRILRYDELSDGKKRSLKKKFDKEVFALCTPLALKPSARIPFISNRSLNLLVVLNGPDGTEMLARVKIPSILPRFMRVSASSLEFVALEDVIASNIGQLFPGLAARGVYIFRVIRDADVEIQELEAADLIASVEESLHLRRFGEPVLVQVGAGMPKKYRRFLLGLLDLEESDLFELEGLLGMDAFTELMHVDKPELRFAPFAPNMDEQLSSYEQIFATLKKNDVLLHHPYDSFRTIEEFVAAAAKDPQVIGIKVTLYRVGEQSPIVESLMDAASAGKQVAAVVELKARFDESNNLTWAKALERAGVHVILGTPSMKTHCKLCLVVRDEPDGIRLYAHIATGNYNPSTARQYTDLGFMTTNADVVQDAASLFNALSGFATQTSYKSLLVAPTTARTTILSLVRREISAHRKSGNGRIIIKANAFVDPDVIDSLYDASNEGVRIDLIIRGICSLRPLVPGMSENIAVRSIVGRFLEHSRVFYFANGGNPEAYIGSADLMRRNLDRRVEAMIRIDNPAIVGYIRDFYLNAYLRDTENCWNLQSDGTYSKEESALPFDVQKFFIGNSDAQQIFSVDSRVKS